MKEKTLGAFIGEMRIKQGLTQLDLADRMRVTVKEVSKWERDVAYPDVNDFARLSELLGTDADTLVEMKAHSNLKHSYGRDMTENILKGMAVAMGLAVIVMSVMDEITLKTGMLMLGTGLLSGSLALVMADSK